MFGAGEFRRPECWPRRRDAGRVSEKSGRRMVVWSASWWSCPQRPSLGDRRVAWREWMLAWRASATPLSVNLPARVRDDELGSERERPVNLWESVNQRIREFWAEILGGIELLTAELTFYVSVQSTRTSVLPPEGRLSPARRAMHVVRPIYHRRHGVMKI